MRKFYAWHPFNVFAHNRDDHSKNFSFLMDEKGNWKFAPAYDLTFFNPSHGWHSITINGESKTPGKKHLTALAQYFKIKKGSEIIEQVETVIKNWKYYAKEYGVEKDSLQKMAHHLPRQPTIPIDLVIIRYYKTNFYVVRLNSNKVGQWSLWCASGNMAARFKCFFKFSVANW